MSSTDEELKEPLPSRLSRYVDVAEGASNALQALGLFVAKIGIGFALLYYSLNAVGWTYQIIELQRLKLKLETMKLRVELAEKGIDVKEYIDLDGDWIKTSVKK